MVNRSEKILLVLPGGGTVYSLVTIPTMLTHYNYRYCADFKVNLKSACRFELSVKCTIKRTCWRLLSQLLGWAWLVLVMQLLLPSLSAHLIQESRTAHQTHGCGINPALVQPTQHLEELLIKDTVTENNYTLKRWLWKFKIRKLG
jgi:hypothetical protein